MTPEDIIFLEEFIKGTGAWFEQMRVMKNMSKNSDMGMCPWCGIKLVGYY